MRAILARYLACAASLLLLGATWSVPSGGSVCDALLRASPGDEVVVAPGIYREQCDAGWSWTHRGESLSIRAPAGATWSGGAEVAGWDRSGPDWVALAPDAPAGIEHLYAGGGDDEVRLRRARWPDEVDPYDPYRGDAENMRRPTGGGAGRLEDPALAALGWNAGGGVVVVLDDRAHAVRRCPIEAHAGNELELGSCKPEEVEFGAEDWYAIEHPAALDAEGEWALRGDQLVVRSRDRPEDVTATVRGWALFGRAVDLEIEGFEFRHFQSADEGGIRNRAVLNLRRGDVVLRGVRCEHNSKRCLFAGGGGGYDVLVEDFTGVRNSDCGSVLKCGTTTTCVVRRAHVDANACDGFFAGENPGVGHRDDPAWAALDVRIEDSRFSNHDLSHSGHTDNVQFARVRRLEIARSEIVHDRPGQKQLAWSHRMGDVIIRSSLLAGGRFGVGAATTLTLEGSWLVGVHVRWDFGFGIFHPRHYTERMTARRNVVVRSGIGMPICACGDAEVCPSGCRPGRDLWNPRTGRPVDIDVGGNCYSDLSSTAARLWRVYERWPLDEEVERGLVPEESRWSRRWLTWRSQALMGLDLPGCPLPLSRPPTCGDTDGDGVVTAADLANVYRAFRQMADPSEFTCAPPPRGHSAP